MVAAKEKFEIVSGAVPPPLGFSWGLSYRMMGLMIYGVSGRPVFSVDRYIYRIYNSCMKTLINIRADVDVKRRAQKAARELGIPLSTIVNAYLKQLGREQRINFVVPLRPNKKTAELLRQASKDRHVGRNVSPAFSTSEEMDAYLNS